MKTPSNNNKSIKLFTFIVGFIISGMILFESLANQTTTLSASHEAVDSLQNEQNEVEYNKTLITNSYLLGVSIYKLKESID